MHVMHMPPTMQQPMQPICLLPGLQPMPPTTMQPMPPTMQPIMPLTMQPIMPPTMQQPMDPMVKDMAWLAVPALKGLQIFFACELGLRTGGVGCASSSATT
jgi:hypothetical protein